jgi:hypothetical protein
MNFNKLIFGLAFIVLLNGCTQSAALLGPVYTLSSTGNIYQAGLSYGSNQIVTRATGKSTSENLLNIIDKAEKKFENKNDSINHDFYYLVKSSIEKTRKIINLSNQ